MLYVLKFKFAGSGDLVWRKVVNGSVSRNQQNDLVKIAESGGQTYVTYGPEVEEAYGHMEYIKSEGMDSKNVITSVLDREAMEKEFGKQGIPAFVWIKEKPSKKYPGLKKIIEVTIPGPQAFWGAADTGSFSIENNVSKSMIVLEKYIEEWLSQGNEIYIKIKGHSRGGVAGNIVFNKLSQKYKSNDKVRICAVTFDPVPGPSLTFLSDRSSNSGSYDKLVLEDEAKGAVVYSIDPKQPLGSIGFTPQKIYNYPVTIITEFDHSSGLYETITSSSGEVKKAKYKFNGKEYAPGKLYKLPKQLYWANKNFDLEVIDASNYREKIDFLIKNSAWNRYKFLKNLIYTKVITQTMISEITKGDVSNCRKILQGLGNLFYKDAKIVNLVGELSNMLPRTITNAQLSMVSKAAPAMKKVVEAYKSKTKTKIKQIAAEELIKYLDSISIKK